MPAGQLQTFDRRISQTTWSFETKLWGDDEHPKERWCPKNYGLKLPTTPEIAKLGQEHYELGFIRKSTNRRPNPMFEGSISSTKRNKALTHDLLKEIRRETPSNRQIERWTKIAQKELRKPPKRKTGKNSNKPWGTMPNHLYIPWMFIQGLAFARSSYPLTRSHHECNIPEIWMTYHVWIFAKI
jgi:hypothetical protein